MRLIIPLMFLFLCCKSQVKTSASGTEKERETGELIVKTNVQTPKLDEIPANHAKILASVSEIYPVTEGSQFPCSDYPCRALVKVEKVMGYGHSFGGPLSQGQMMEIYFPLSMGPTKEVFPDRQVKDLPGLKKGSIFEANVGSTLKPGNETAYRVTTYEVKSSK